MAVYEYFLFEDVRSGAMYLTRMSVTVQIMHQTSFPSSEYNVPYQAGAARTCLVGGSFLV